LGCGYSVEFGTGRSNTYSCPSVQDFRSSRPYRSFLPTRFPVRPPETTVDDPRVPALSPVARRRRQRQDGLRGGAADLEAAGFGTRAAELRCGCCVNVAVTGDVAALTHGRHAALSPSSTSSLNNAITRACNRSRHRWLWNTFTLPTATGNARACLSTFVAV